MTSDQGPRQIAAAFLQGMAREDLLAFVTEVRTAPPIPEPTEPVYEQFFTPAAPEPSDYEAFFPTHTESEA